MPSCKIADCRSQLFNFLCSRNLTINPLAVTLTGTRSYDGTNTASYNILTVSNVHGLDTVIVASGSATLAGADAGTRAINDFSSLTLSGSSASDYTLTGASGNVTINPLAATWTTNDNSKTYGSGDPSPLTTGTGTFLTVDNVTADYSRVSGEDVNTYHITATLHSSRLTDAQLAADYSITNAGATFTINQLAVVLSGTRTYDGTTTANAGILTITNKLPGDTLTLSGSATLSGANAGPEAISDFSGLTLGGSAANDYTLTGASGTVSITPLAATWTTNDNSKTYGSADPNPLTTGTGTFLTVDNVTAVYTRVTGEDVNTYHITATLHSSRLTDAQLAADYSITNAGATFTINPLAVVLSGTRTYDGTTTANAGILTVPTKSAATP